MDLIFRMSRLFVAMTMLTGPSFPAYAGTSAPASPDKGTPVSFGRGQKTDQGARARATVGHFNLPLYFEANHGQTDPSVKFLSRGAGYNLFLTASQAVMVLPRAKADKAKESVVVRMKLNGANANPTVRGLDILPGYTNYLLSNDPSKYQTGVERYAKVKFSHVYPGIDMVYYGKQGHVEHDFVVAPGANPGRILVGFEGGKDLRLDPQGNLIVGVEGGELTYQAPALYQMRGGKRNPVKGSFVLAGKNQVRFAVGDYIRSKELVIDPSLTYSTFLGGTVADRAFAITADATGNTWVTGETANAPFPGTGVAPGFQVAYGGGAFDVFVAKFNATGTLVWATLYGGTGDDIGRGIAVDAAFNVYVTGSATAGVLPAKKAPAAVETKIGAGGGTDAFLVAFAPDGKDLVYAPLRIGGNGEEYGRGIAADTAGNVYITGETNSAGFVTTPGAAQPIIGGGGNSDAFVMKFDPTGVLAYSTFLGGTGIDVGNAIAIQGGNAYITGETSANLPVVPTAAAGITQGAFKQTIAGSNAAFIAKLTASGAAWDYVTYVGGSDQEAGTGIAVPAADIVYITGWTISADFPSPGNDVNGVPYANTRIGAYQPTRGVAPDAFVFKLHIRNPGFAGGAHDGVYSTYLGGSGEDDAYAIAVDAAGNAYVTGQTWSGDFPNVSPISGGGSLTGTPDEAFVTEINPTGGGLIFSTYLGAAGETAGRGIALDGTNNVYVTGWTSAAGFPSTVGPALNGPFDAFVTKIAAPAGPPPVACTITGMAPSSGLSNGGTTVKITGTGFTGVVAANAVTFGGTNATSFSVNGANTEITAVTPRHPIAGALTSGTESLVVSAGAGPCSTNYAYTFSPTGACGNDFFFPSPATGATGTFAYCMTGSGTMIIKIWNVIGDLVAKVEDRQLAGANISLLNTARLAPGVYLYRTEKRYDSGVSDRSGVKKFTVQR